MTLRVLEGHFPIASLVKCDISYLWRVARSLCIFEAPCLVFGSVVCHENTANASTLMCAVARRRRKSLVLAHCDYSVASWRAHPGYESNYFTRNAKNRVSEI